MSNDTLSTTEVSEMIGAKEATLRSWVRAGLVAPENRGPGTGGGYRWSESDVEAARLLHEEGGRGEAAKAAMAILPESLLSRCANPDWSEVASTATLVMCEHGRLKVQLTDTISDVLARARGAFVVLSRE